MQRSKMLVLTILLSNIVNIFGHLGSTKKIVGMLTIRNEQIFIAQCLRSLCRYTDAIVIVDDASNDNTLKIIQSLAKECNIEKIISKDHWYRDEAGDKNKLLNAARQIGGTHFVFIDADEMFTSNCSENNYLRNKILELTPGQKMHVKFYNLWRSFDYFREDSSQWSPRFINCIFCDDGKCCYEAERFIHCSHIPDNLKGQDIYLNDPIYGLMHFQFINWRNLLIKQAWYRCLEHIRNPSFSIDLLNEIYGKSKDERGLGLRRCPQQWFTGYKTIFDPEIIKLPEVWREKQVLEWFEEHGKDFFKDLDIWDVDWGNGLKN